MSLLLRFACQFFGSTIKQDAIAPIIAALPATNNIDDTSLLNNFNTLDAIEPNNISGKQAAILKNVV